MAELYLYGGYYFDIDIGVVKPLDVDALPIPTEILEPTWNLHSIKKNRLKKAETDDRATFVTVVNKQGRFFQAFTASMPRHPVLKRSLGTWGLMMIYCSFFSLLCMQILMLYLNYHICVIRLHGPLL